ncbi:Soluble pyridine nucleotide transhydrogenase (STH) (NAD(P)(+) transhydrogenase [B-specific]) [Durusdinium trenchii]|uniref:NAD(P)(+) transhydrogenase (Si-specific) n=1 Tax=Durusdinium trenchii TaxID=1381693 RepID=A0ABP0RNV9_9DINO
MDRVIEEPPLKASGCSRCASFFFGFGRRHQYHHGRLGCCGRRDRPALRLHINEDSECFFFRDDGCGHLRLHHNSFSSDSAASEDESDSSSEESFFAQEGKMVTLIYSRSGDHLTCRLQHLDHLGPNAGQLIFTANEEEDKKALRILKSDQPLLIYSPMQGGSGVLLHRGGGCIQTRVDRLVGMQDAALQKYCCCNLHCALALCLFLIMYAFALCIGGTGYPGYAAIVFLLLPELVDDFLPNATTSPSKSHLYDGKLDTEIKVTFNQGWTCVSGADQSGKDYMIEFSALWAATFILACCTISLIYGCYYLHNASDFLGMLNDLLWRRAGANYRTWRLRKLHSIRSSVENKRFLEFLAQGSLPGLTIEDDDELQWWVDTRAALFEDIRFNLEKRKPILGLCLLAELMLIVVTILSLLLHENDFALTCYAVTYGCALGILTLLCIFLCSQVNEKLRHCTSIMRGTEDAEEDVPREDMPRASLLLGTEPSSMFRAALAFVSDRQQRQGVRPAGVPGRRGSDVAGGRICQRIIDRRQADVLASPKHSPQPAALGRKKDLPKARTAQLLNWLDFRAFLQSLDQVDPPAAEVAAAEPPPPEGACEGRVKCSTPVLGVYDLLVLGCGPAGVTAALEAASRGLHVAVLEPLRKPTGAPTGAYSKCIREAVMDKKWTWPEIHQMVQQITLNANRNTMRMLRVFHVEVLHGSAEFLDATTVQLNPSDAKGAAEPRRLSASAVVVATGSRANRLPMIDFELPGVFDSDTISQLDFIPKSMVVQGGGIIGLEYANMFAKLGAKVVVVEFMENILQMLDCDLKAALLTDLASNKVEILLKTGITGVKSLDGGVRGKPYLVVETTNGSFRCEALLSAVGRCGSTDGLQLERIGIKIGRGKMIQVDENQYTGVGKIYAVGDVAGGNLATIGQAQAVRAVRKMFGSGQYTLQDKAVKPYTVWTIPEISWAGVNQQEAEAQGLNFGVVQADYGKTVRGIVTGESGFLKLIFDSPSGVQWECLAVEAASELINFGADAVNHGTTIFDILQFVFPAVTFHTLYGWAAAEAKIKFSGVKSLSGGAGWSRLRRTIIRHLERTNSELTFEEAVCQAFLAFDTDSSGFLDNQQLKEAMKSLGVDMDDEAIQEMMNEADESADGVVDYGEFLAACVFLRGKVHGSDKTLQRGNTGTLNLRLPSKVRVTYDLVVLGCGPAGLKAALEAAGRGLRVALIEPKEHLTAAPTGAHSKCMRESVMENKVTWPEIRTLIERVVRDAEANAARLLRTFHVSVLRGSGSFADESTIRFTDEGGNSQILKTTGTVIATGSKANRLPMVPFDLPGVYDSDTLAEIDYIPKNMVIQGGGIIGLEYANIFAKMGAQVVVVEFTDKVLQMVDCDLQAALLAELANNKVELKLKTAIKTIKKGEGGTRGHPVLIVDLYDSQIHCDCFLSATGRCGQVDDLNLEALGVKLGRGRMIQVDENQHTGVGHIYAVGDCAGGNLATVGQAQAVRAVRKLFGSGIYTLKDKEAKPYIVWTIPEVAWVGLNEQEAQAKDLDFGVVRVEYHRAVRGIVSGEEGFLKMIYDVPEARPVPARTAERNEDRPQGRVLGVHICGVQAGELINFGADAINNQTTIFDMLQFVFPAVTYHVLYNAAAAEAKLRMAGVKDLSAAASWARDAWPNGGRCKVEVVGGSWCKWERSKGFSTFVWLGGMTHMTHT